MQAGGAPQTPGDAAPSGGSGLASNDLLLNLGLLNAVFVAIHAFRQGLTPGMAFAAGVGFVLVGMSLVLALSWLVLRPFDGQARHVVLANAIMVTLLLLQIGVLGVQLAA